MTFEQLFPIVFPITTLLLGIIFELLREKISKSSAIKKEYIKIRFSSLLFPLYLVVCNFEYSQNPQKNNSIEYYLEKSKLIYQIINKYAYYSTPQLLFDYTYFSRELYDNFIDESNIKRLSYSFYLFYCTVSNEYNAMEKKVLKKIKTNDLFREIKKDIDIKSIFE